jgi:hypothetical protein
VNRQKKEKYKTTKDQIEPTNKTGWNVHQKPRPGVCEDLMAFTKKTSLQIGKV